MLYPEARKDMEIVKTAIQAAELAGHDTTAAYDALLRLLAALLEAS